MIHWKVCVCKDTMAARTRMSGPFHLLSSIPGVDSDHPCFNSQQLFTTAIHNSY